MTGLQALEALKNGCTVRRAAWPEGQYAKIINDLGLADEYEEIRLVMDGINVG